jgi:hypothetical protein
MSSDFIPKNNIEMKIEDETKWYSKKISEENVPSNIIFLKNIKKNHLHYKSIKINDKVSSGFKNLELC